MKISCCTQVSNLEILKKAGLDLIEISAFWLSQLDDKAFDEVKETLDKSGLRAKSCNGLIAGIKPLFEDKDFINVNSYLDKLFPRLQVLGINIAVFGSGVFRNVPDGVSEDEKKEKISEFLKFLTGKASKYGITVVIEPLNTKESNVLTNTDESVWYINALNIDNLKLLVDLYHFAIENEDFNNLIKYKDLIKHVHIARPDSRISPHLNDGYDYTLFFGNLKKTGYDGIISIEAGYKDFENDIINAKALIERYWEKA